MEKVTAILDFSKLGKISVKNARWLNGWIMLLWSWRFFPPGEYSFTKGPLLTNSLHYY